MDRFPFKPVLWPGPAKQLHRLRWRYPELSLQRLGGAAYLFGGGSFSVDLDVVTFIRQLNVITNTTLDEMSTIGKEGGK